LRTPTAEPADLAAAERIRLRRTALAAAAGTLLLRLPFAARRLWDHDSIQFALGVERYDLAAHHPHPPGYPLYIALLKLLAALGVDPLHGMVGFAIVIAALGAGLLVPLVARLLAENPEGGPDARGRLRAGPLTAAAFAAALYATNPLLWFYGELPLLYAVEAGVSVVLAWAALRMADGRGAFLAACALFALAGGLRQSTLVLLAPLFLCGALRAWRRGTLTVGRLVAGAALGGAIALAWFLPLCAAAGGYQAYRRIGAEHFGALLPKTSILYGAGWGALAHNLEILVKWGLQGVLPGAVALLLLWTLAPGRVAPGLRLLLSGLPWLLAWALPPVLFFALFHITKAGYTLIHLPALLVVLAVAAAPALAASRPRAVAATAVAVAMGSGLFLFGADRGPDQPRLLAVVRNEFNRGAIAAYERDLDRMIETVRGYPPTETVLATVELSGTGAAAAEGFLYPWHRHLQWYLPEYPVVLLVPEERFALVAQGHVPFAREDGVVELPATTRRVLFVLSGPLDGRLALAGPGVVAGGSSTFRMIAVPFRGELRVGPLLLTATPRRKAA
jgi:transmembrane protein TMEM260 (protein O-mannosyltransferase)